MLASFLLPIFLGGPGAGDERGGEVNPAEQISFILSEPFAYAGIFADFLQWYVHPNQAINVLVDLCGIESAYAVRYPLMVLLPVVALLDRAPCDVALATHPKRLCMLALTLLTIFLMATALYISFTPPHWDIIAGMQGRYLIPLLFPFLALCLPFASIARRIGGVDRRIICGLFMVLSAAMLFWGIHDGMLMRHY